jgi:hypothetical protein
MRSALAAIAVPIALLAAAPAGALIKPVRGEHAHVTAPLKDLRPAAARVPAHVRRARAAFLRDAGPQAFLSTDRVTGAVRFIGRTDGYLSGPAQGDAASVALRWVRGHLDVLGLEPADMASFHLVHRYTAPNGVTRLIFQQRFRGIPAFDNSLRVNVAADGRIVNAGGSPRSAPRVPGVVPSVPRPAGGRLRLVSTGPATAVLAWRVWLEESSEKVWDLLVDARTGAVIRRASKVKFANGQAWDYYPGAPAGGTPRTVDFTPWLTGPDRLLGNNAHVYNDADNTEDCAEVTCDNDDLDPTQAPMGDIVTPNEEIRPQGVTSGDWLYGYTPIPSPAGYCPQAGCAWNHLVNGSWLPNRDQDGTQVFFFVNRFHDHLAAAPISFTEEAGNFQFANPSGAGKANDGVFASSMDSAGQLAGRPIPVLHSDNANMLTRPDGQAPRMQMYLFEPLEVGEVLPYPFSDVSGGGDGSVVYHEYTHGLTNRLVIDADGKGALDGAQSGAMGEAWSDWYAMDFLMKQGFERDTERPGEIKVGAFVDGGQNLVRTEPIDCTLGAPADACPRRRSALAGEGGGGYTYEHFGHISSGPEVHADGEIWVQTLMDLRRRLVADHGEASGVERAESLVTRALTLAPDNPSMVDMRNAILQADLVAGKRDHTRIWQVFAPRGFGASAAAVDGDDRAPTAAFDLPPGLPAPDMTAPALTVDLPLEDGVVRAEAATLAGTAVDDAGVTGLTVNGVPARLNGSTWDATITIAPGRQVVTVVARDIEGRTATVVRRVIGDAAAPRLKVRRPVRRAGRVQIRGTVSDDTGVATVRVAGRRVGVSRRGAFFAAVRKVRRRRVTVEVTDRAGRVARRTVRVR